MTALFNFNASQSYIQVILEELANVLHHSLPSIPFAGMFRVIILPETVTIWIPCSYKRQQIPL